MVINFMVPLKSLERCSSVAHFHFSKKMSVKMKIHFTNTKDCVSKGAGSF